MIMSFWRPEVTSLPDHFVKLNKTNALSEVENLMKQLFHSPLLDTRLVIASLAISARDHGIIGKYKVYTIEPSTRYMSLLYFILKVIQVSSQAWYCTNEENGAAGGSVLDFQNVFFHS